MIKLRIAAAAAAAIYASTAVGETITASIWLPDTHPLVKVGYLDFAKEIKSVSGGELDIQVFTGTSVLPPVAHLSGLKDGIVDMTYHAGTYTPSDLPEDNAIASLSIGLSDSIAAAVATGDFYFNDPQIQEMFSRQGLVFLGSYASAQYLLMCTSRIEDISDLKGKKLRMPTPVHAAWAENVGAVSVNVPSSEMYSGLEKGQLDCAANAANDLKARSLWDVAKYATELDLGPYYAGWLYAMPTKRWQALSVSNKKILLDTIPGATIASTIAQIDASSEALAEAGEHGVEILQPSEDLRNNLRDFVSNSVTELSVETGDRLGVKDAGSLVARYLATYQEWKSDLDAIDRQDTDAIVKAFEAGVYQKIDLSTYGQ
tara:strand:+ start:8603 stop:9721 length:1119 start_codon:yes stop_codon:yes gene_type:complete